MKMFSVKGMVLRPVYLGEVEANNQYEAVEMVKQRMLEEMKTCRMNLEINNLEFFDHFYAVETSVDENKNG